jgi:hypothetical protein
MNEQERAIIRKLYDLQMELFDAQGEEIAALKRANDSLQRSHAIIGELLTLTAKLAGFA